MQLTDSARLFFDDCIEASMASAIRVSALLGLFNILNKATVAIAYFGKQGAKKRYMGECANESRIRLVSDGEVLEAAPAARRQGARYGKKDDFCDTHSEITQILQ